MNKTLLLIALIILTLLLNVPAQLFAEDSKLLATGGVSQVEGSAGGGIVPWAVIAGYAQDDEIGATAFNTTLSTDDFKLNVIGVAVGINNQYEFSFARQTLDLGPLQNNLGLPSNQLKQDVFGFKMKLLGDLVYDYLPQVSLGVQYKKVDDFTIPSLVGAIDSSGTDIYIAASKLWLNGISGIPFLANVTLRSTQANQLGFLGFGGNINSSRELMWELNTSFLISRELVLGYEFRQKPNNLSFSKENNWQDIYLAWFYDKSISGVIGWADLDTLAGLSNQQGLYLSIQATF